MDNENLKNQINQWANSCLLSLGYSLKSHIPENVLNTPWSYLIRFETSDGYIYLKHMPELFALEPTIIKILHDQFHARVPITIGQNDELNCFLMKDAGRPLREILKKKFEVELFCRAIEQFTSLQIAVADCVDVFFEIGVPDYRLDKLPGLYEELTTRKDLLIEDGLSEEEVIQLQKLLPIVNHLCKKLSDYPIKQTIVQPDFNDNNILINEMEDITIIDLGEIVISHPFFSLFNCLSQVRKHHGLIEENVMYLKIQDACFKNYMKYFESKEQFLTAVDISKVLYYVYGMSYQYRFMIACGKERLISFQHWKLGNLLREFIALVGKDKFLVGHLFEGE